MQNTRFVFKHYKKEIKTLVHLKNILVNFFSKINNILLQQTIICKVQTMHNAALISIALYK